jgi:tRNA A37 threonylcarbamoyladenosine modification protein TsaB
MIVPLIDNLLKKNKIEYSSLNNLVVINGPGSFTWIRTCVLAVNSINYIIDKSITSLSFFDLYKTFPIVKTSSKKDYFLQKDKNSSIEIISNDDFNNYLIKNNITKVYWEYKNEVLKNIINLEKIDYLDIIKNIKFTKNKQIRPLYIKKPNIS